MDRCLITCNEQLTLITELREWTECRASQKRSCCGKSTKSLYSAPSKRQTSGSVFVERIEKVKKTKFELGLSKIEDCFSNGHGNYDSILLTFKVKSFHTNQFLKSEENCIYQLVVQMI